MVKNKAANGLHSEDPLAFGHFDVNYVICYYNSQPYPSKAYRPDFAEGNFIREYIGLYDTANQLYGKANLGLTPEEYKGGKTIFGFNFSPDLSDDCNSSGYASLIKRGNLRVELHFEKALPETINVLLYAEYDKIIEINRERNGIIELS